ncbi:unnamed protein product [Parnassius mnemosyne]|uniref:Uncharacterized protein n=1 Tax=Parnassius mnemosyne TaxID=213953 RepID=A0AAV1LNZ1_9NEOP
MAIITVPGDHLVATTTAEIFHSEDMDSEIHLAINGLESSTVIARQGYAWTQRPRRPAKCNSENDLTRLENDMTSLSSMLFDNTMDSLPNLSTIENPKVVELKINTDNLALKLQSGHNEIENLITENFKLKRTNDILTKQSKTETATYTYTYSDSNMHKKDNSNMRITKGNNSFSNKSETALNVQQ